MFIRFLLIFIALPLTDLVVLLLLSRWIGSIYTILIVIGTAVTGAWFAKQQWQWLLNRARVRMHSAELPTELMSDGFLIVMGATLLITPGFLTDLLGISLLIPWSRRWFLARAKEYIRSKVTIVHQEIVRSDVGPEIVDVDARPGKEI